MNAWNELKEKMEAKCDGNFQKKRTIIDTKIGPHECNSGHVYYNKVNTTR